MTELEQWLYMAAESPYGIVLSIDSSDFQLVQHRLYGARRKLNDPALTLLQFRRSPYGVATELWIVKGSPKSTVQAQGEAPGEADAQSDAQADALSAVPTPPSKESSLNGPSEQ